jgi:hypothetical protein
VSFSSKAPVFSLLPVSILVTSLSPSSFVAISVQVVVSSSTYTIFSSSTYTVFSLVSVSVELLHNIIIALQKTNDIPATMIIKNVTTLIKVFFFIFL